MGGLGQKPAQFMKAIEALSTSCGADKSRVVFFHFFFFGPEPKIALSSATDTSPPSHLGAVTANPSGQ